MKSKPSGTELSNARYALGLAQSSAKKFKDAVKTFEQLLKDDGKYADADKVYYELAWSQRGLEKPDEAAESFLKLATNYPKSPLAAEALYHVGDRYYEKQQWKDAAKAYYTSMDMIKEGPLGEKAAHKLGWAYFQQNNFADAEQTFSYQKQTWPQGELAADGQFMSAESLFKQNKYPEALAGFLQVKNPPRKELALLALLHAAQSASALQDWKQSLALATQAAPSTRRALPGRDPLRTRLGPPKSGKSRRGAENFRGRDGQERRRSRGRARFLIGEIYFERKDHKEAIPFSRRQCTITAMAGGCHTRRAGASRCSKTPTKRKSYQEVIEKFP